MMDTCPDIVYLRILHIPGTPAENNEILRYFLDKVVNSFIAGKPADAARYAGTLSHAMEDWGCPAHVVPNDNMFTLFKQFLPPPPEQAFTLLHSPIENGTFTVNLDRYKPRLLGTTVNEAAFNMLRRTQDATRHARAQTIPIIQAIYAGNTNAANAAQQIVAEHDAQLIADTLYTACCLSQKRFEDAQTLNRIDLSLWSPQEAPDLYMPQSVFFGKPHWGHATLGVTMNNKVAVPLQLNVLEHGKPVMKTFVSGIGTGTRSVLTYEIPSDVYTRFTALAGLHAALGKNGKVLFEISGNGRRLALLGPITGDMPAQQIDVSLEGINRIQLTVTSAGGDGTGNYAIWADPKLCKKR